MKYLNLGIGKVENTDIPYRKKMEKRNK